MWSFIAASKDELISAVEIGAAVLISGTLLRLLGKWLGRSVRHSIASVVHEVMSPDILNQRKGQQDIADAFVAFIDDKYQQHEDIWDRIG